MHELHQLESELRLTMIPGVGPRMRMTLLDQFGSAERVLEAAPSRLREIPGVGVKLASAIAGADRIDVGHQLDHCASDGIEILQASDMRYPKMLREIHDPPGLLFVKGEFTCGDDVAIAIVGTRHATSYGIRQAERLSGSLARMGITIVSGLARGIDRTAHEAALDAGGRTIAVLGGGFSHIFPPDHVPLAERIQDQGVLVCENPPFFKPTRSAFPRRNRLISGLSMGLVVVEASARSGALISARHAMEQGREVFAIPGLVDSRTSRGCHQLLRDGAKLVETADDVLDELGPLVDPTLSVDGRTIHHPAELWLNDQERHVLDCVESVPVRIDSVIRASELPVHRVLSTISVLEMRRLVRRHWRGECRAELKRWSPL